MAEGGGLQGIHLQWWGLPVASRKKSMHHVLSALYSFERFPVRYTPIRLQSLVNASPAITLSSV